MMSDEKTVIDSIRFILNRKQDRVSLEDRQFLEISVDDLELDSVDRLDLVMELEQRFDVVFTTSAITGCRTVEEILAVIRAERTRAAGDGLV